ncbi:hypothetical protein BDS110ZK12_79450 [Bradyrhizobium diazoefficiens]|uniref:Uncharacterized protein n=1 Tax=Bradyrhizobium diazoefficiens TaxID=1355477 RepID=A0A810BHJ1_9BRAD|nr:hypothetical protein XF8B_63370 [Bradyrhizobium diazoefficiens]BCF37324.1 hypothetical protein XF15B_63950 [Bradyrhizobium diazoefficiens]
MHPGRCRVAGTARRDCVEALPDSQEPARRAPALSASEEAYDQGLQRLESGSSRPALVCRSAHAKAAAKVTKIATTTMVISNASVGIMLLPGV